MRNAVIDWLALLGVVLSALLGAVVEKETDGEITKALYLDNNITKTEKCEPQLPKIIITDK